MAQTAPKITDVPPPASDVVIDRDHLARMTFGDASLERELLALFDRQAAVLLARMQTTDAAAVAALAHTLKGSALGIGAVRVAQTAAAVEQTTGPVALAQAVNHLAVAIEAARAHIAVLLEAGGTQEG